MTKLMELAEKSELYAFFKVTDGVSNRNKKTRSSSTDIIIY